MSFFKRSSHIRSILKGISWRVIATTDTILVVLLVTCLSGECSIDDALRIGAAEFLIKFAVYYVHERLWELKRVDGKITPRVTLFKSISWRIVASIMTFVIAGTILDGFDSTALIIASVESVSKFILYYAHERIWLTLPLGRVRRYFLKMNKR